jgi:hypothetical protein
MLVKSNNKVGKKLLHTQSLEGGIVGHARSKPHFGFGVAAEAGSGRFGAFRGGFVGAERGARTEAPQRLPKG